MKKCHLDLGWCFASDEQKKEQKLGERQKVLSLFLFGLFPWTDGCYAANDVKSWLADALAIGCLMIPYFLVRFSPNRYRQSPNPVSDRSRMVSGICFRYFRPKLVVPKYASKLATGSTTQSVSSGLLAK